MLLFLTEFVIIAPWRDIVTNDWMKFMVRLNNLIDVKVLCLPCILLVSGCATQATAWTEKITTQKVELPTECVGWQKINVKNRTRYFMMKEDQRALVDIDAHNLRGRNLGCWDTNMTQTQPAQPAVQQAPQNAAY
ncbi:hypothetical protein [uncultured Bartonella sp.]|uniref:hypothetical protein n=1 Tax=uncultured Bartonella sp. TaxID=104108 RepID=UPI00263347AF|nr:hypothetical protein [uncultured Bartonella sp.]